MRFNERGREGWWERRGRMDGAEMELGRVVKYPSIKTTQKRTKSVFSWSKISREKKSLLGHWGQSLGFSMLTPHTPLHPKLVIQALLKKKNHNDLLSFFKTASTPWAPSVASAANGIWKVYPNSWAFDVGWAGLLRFLLHAFQASCNYVFFIRLIFCLFFRSPRRMAKHDKSLRPSSITWQKISDGEEAGGWDRGTSGGRGEITLQVPPQ